MSSEEKILAILEKQGAALDKAVVVVEQMQGDILELKQGQAETNRRLEKLEQGQTKLEQGQVRLESEVTRIRQSVATIEVEHGKSLGALHDGYSLVYEGMKYITPIVENTAEKVSVIEAAVSINTDRIKVLEPVI